MAARTTCPSIPAAQEPTRPQRLEACVDDLETATENFAQALAGLQILAEQPGYEFVDKLLTGYLWSLEQIQEVTTNLKDQLKDLERQVKSPDR